MLLFTLEESHNVRIMSINIILHYCCRKDRSMIITDFRTFYTRYLRQLKMEIQIFFRIKKLK